MLTRRGFLTTTAIGALGMEAGLGTGRPASATAPGTAQQASPQRGDRGGDRPTVTLTVDGTAATVAAAAETPLLWVLREHLGLSGTKYGGGTFTAVSSPR